MANLILCRSDAGDGGWSLHPPGTTDEAIANGDARILACGEAERDGAGWDRPNAADYRKALEQARGAGLLDGPYIADGFVLGAWAEDGDKRAAEFLAYPGAVLFGIDDGDVQAWFADAAQADKWLAGILDEMAERLAARSTA